MKKSNQAIQLTLMLFAVIVIAGCNKPKQPLNTNIGVHTIVLQVNTEDIHPGADVEKYASFVGQLPDSTAKYFTTNVSLGDTIIWIGVSSSNLYDDEVLIEQINYHGGDNLLGQNVIDGKNGRVIATIKGTGKEEKYTIRFKVKKSGGGPNPNPNPNPTYSIDPKLRVL